jgi:antitoxin (DNA-binding transcriptional repressor) of toxin-antitoxin stability system
MKSTNIRDLHINTSAIVKEVAEGESFIIVKHGVSVAELRPIPPVVRSPRLPDREAYIATLPPSLDSGRILEEDR